MKTLVVNRNLIVLIFSVMLLTYSVQGISYGQDEVVIVTQGDAPTVIPGEINTTLRVDFTDILSAGDKKAYQVQLRRKSPQGEWITVCPLIKFKESNSSSSASVGVGFSFFFGLFEFDFSATESESASTPDGKHTIYTDFTDLEPGVTYEVRYRDTNLSECIQDPPSPGPWSAIAEGTTHLVPPPRVEFANANIARMIRELLNLDTEGKHIELLKIPETELTKLTQVTTLDLASKDIGNLSDLTLLAPYLTSLSVLYLRDNNINDLTPLAQLTSLSTLSLWDNNINDLTPLTHLTSLSILDLTSNNISDLTPLAKLTSLNRLGLQDNNISDVTPLAQLTSLTELDLRNNNIKNLTPLARLSAHTRVYLDPPIQPYWATTTEIGFFVRHGNNDTSLVVQINDTDIGVRWDPGFVFQWRQKEPEGNWHEGCVTMKENEIQRKGTGAVIINNLTPNTTYEVRYRKIDDDGFFDCDSSFYYVHGQESDKWSSIAEGTTSGTSNTNDTDTTPDPQATTGTTVSITPASVASPAVGQQVVFSLKIADGEAVAGYQATVQFDTTALRYVSSANGDFLPAGAFFVEPKVEGNLVKLNATSLLSEVNGDGTLATLTFEVIAAKASTLTLSNVLLTNSAGDAFVPTVENASDVNGDGIVNIQDLVLVASNLNKTGQNVADVNGDGTVNIADLVLVAGALGNSAAAPSLNSQALEMLTATDVKKWLSAAQYLNLTDATSQRGVLFLQQLLVVLTPKETALLANYPNPFNPETWIPYHLAKDADVTLRIYAVNGTLVRTLTLGHQAAGLYQNRSRAAYWDGQNEFGEPVASGVYFYTLTAGDFAATRKMLIQK
ncbi:MAG: cohesin domain-containing protein [Candidatus Poribacteria bacterium]|nr:cohesin domain-containing protein [Candidatus Poribacteria bacterium]